MVKGDWTPHGKITQTLKDFLLVREQATSHGQELPLAQTYIDLVQACVAAGEGEWDNSEALFLNQRWLWNTLDDPVNPRVGSTFQLQMGGASEALLSTRTFGRVHVRANHLRYLLPQV